MFEMKRSCFTWELNPFTDIDEKKEEEKEKEWKSKGTRKCKAIEQMNVTLNEFLRLHRDSKVGTMIDLFLE